MAQHGAAKVFLQWYRFLPYHVARLRAAQERFARDGIQLVGLETAGRDEIYSASATVDPVCHPRLTIFPDRSFHTIPPREILPAVRRVLDAHRPDAVAINGYGMPDGRACLLWCQRTGTPAILMSETWRGDARRVRWREGLKSLLIRRFDAALVGGSPQQDYLVELGLARERIFLGYDAVDNDHFAAGAVAARRDALRVRSALALPENFFLTAGRFVPEKNLETLLVAYARYRQGTASGTTPWHLVLLGSGPLEAELRARAGRPDLAGWVHFPGFASHDDLPKYYGLAGAFVLPSVVEPWGLVVNEAMAAGLPVLVSERAGCASDLVNDSVNGYTFNPLDEGGLARRMAMLAGDEAAREAMGRASAARIAAFGPARFAEGLWNALVAAREQRRRARSSRLAQWLLWFSLRK